MMVWPRLLLETTADVQVVSFSFRGTTTSHVTHEQRMDTTMNGPFFTQSRKRWRSPTLTHPRCPCSVVKFRLSVLLCVLAPTLTFVVIKPFTPFGHPRRSPVARDSVAFPAPDGGMLGAEEGFSQEFQCPFPPLRRPLTLRTESSPERGLWLFEQPFNSVPTLEISIRMAVYALADGTIIVYNPIAPTEETLREIEDAFGQPDHIVSSSNSIDHTVFLRGWAERFPRATFWGLKGVSLPGAHFTRILSTETFPEGWRKELDLSVMKANPFLQECFLYHRSTKTVFAMDSFVLLTPESVPAPLLQRAFTAVGILDTPCCILKPLMQNRRGCQEAIGKTLEWDFSTVYPTHGECPIYDGKTAMAAAFQFLWD